MQGQEEWLRSIAFIKTNHVFQSYVLLVASTSFSSSSTVADENLLNNLSSPADQTIVVNFSKLKFPAKLIDRVEKNEDGQKVLKAIFLHVRSNGGYDKCFGFGKKGRFLDGAASALFNVDGLLNK